jgi:hypothetical protein
MAISTELRYRSCSYMVQLQLQLIALHYSQATRETLFVFLVSHTLHVY